LPENIRKTIEDFNRLPKEEQSVALSRMREDLRLHADKVEKFAQELDLSKGRGRGMGGSSELEMKFRRGRDRGQDQEWEQ
jgi:hypothetical protein